MPTEADTVEDEDGLHELVDITTKEMSLVDRAANGHRFILVKRSPRMPESKSGEEIVENEDGELTTSGSEDGAKDSGGDSSGTEETVEKIALTKASKETLKSGIAKSLELLTALSVVVEKADESDDAEALPESVADALAKASEALAGSIPEGTEVEEVEKVGRKMAGARLRKLRAVVAELSKMLEELDDSEKEPTEKGDAEGPESEPEDVAKRVEELVTKAVAGAVEKALEPVVDAMDDLSKGVAEQRDRVELIAKAAKPPQSIPDDGEQDPKPEPAPKSVGWTHDLNADSVPEDRRFD